MDLKNVGDSESLKEAESILEELFYNKMMSYQTDESSYILKEHIVLNYWKILEENRTTNSDSKNILRMLRIGHLYLTEEYQTIMPKGNNLQLLSLILAKQEYSAQCFREALGVCNQAINLDNKLTKDSYTLLKIHYLRVKIFKNLNEPDLELKEINKCFHFLKTTLIHNRQTQDEYNYFRRTLISRKAELISQNQKKIGILKQDDLIEKNYKQVKNAP